MSDMPGDQSRFNAEMATSLLKMAGFSVKQSYFNNEDIYELRNQYSTSYNDPWFIIKTDIGPIIIGWRKRVLNINWQFTEFRGIVTEDNVTKDKVCVHAWDYTKALEYLTSLNKLSKETIN